MLDHNVLKVASPTVGPVKSIVVLARNQNVLCVDCTAVKLDAVIRPIMAVDIIEGRPAPDCVQRNCVQFIVSGNRIASITNLNVG